MVALTPRARITVLRFAASFAWSCSPLSTRAQAFLLDLANELETELEHTLLARPPRAEDVDPTHVDPALADRVRQAALRAIASSRRIEDHEMEMFDLLDELLPESGAPSITPRARAPSRAP